MLPEQQQRILGYFIEEARDHLNTIEQGLLNLESTLNDPEMINEVFRAAHSIKGGAAMLGLSSIQHTSHRLEDCFKVLKENTIQVDQKLESLFLGVSDTLKALLEHLSGPFGLSEETANTLMSETEPVFRWLNEHLEVLVQQGNSQSQATEIQTATTVNNSTITQIGLRDFSSVGAAAVNSGEISVAQLPEAENWGEFQTEVLQILREMLQLFKQQTTPQTRQRLQECCHQLVKLGEELSLPNWCSLCQATAKAIANPKNTYLTLAKIVITEIKQAQELVLQGRDANITTSPQLQALLELPEIQPSANPIATAIAHPVEAVQSEDTINSQSEPSPQLHPEVDTQPVEKNPVEISSFLNTFSDEPNDAPTNHITIDSKGPEVGIAELNTLADLFEGETPELDDTWQQEEILEINTTNDLGIDTSGDIEDVDSDLADLLSFDEDTNTDEPQTTQDTTADLSLLFGDNFLEKENKDNLELAPSGIFDHDPTLRELSQTSHETWQFPVQITSQDALEDLLDLEFDASSSSSNNASPSAEVAPKDVVEDLLGLEFDAPSSSTNDALPSLEVASQDVVEDLLGLEFDAPPSSTNNASPSIEVAQKDVVEDLLGLESDAPSSSTNDALPSLEVASQDVVEDLLGLEFDASSSSSNNASPSIEVAQKDVVEDLLGLEFDASSSSSNNASPSAEVASQDVVEDLLGLEFDAPPSLPQDEVIQLENVNNIHPELQLNQSTSFDDLFTESENAKPVAEDTLSHNLEFHLHPSQPENTSLDNLLVEFSEDTSKSVESLDIGDVFASPPPSTELFFDTVDEQGKFWDEEVPVQQKDELNFVFEQDVAQELEASLFSAAAANDFFGEQQHPEQELTATSVTTNFDLQDFDISFSPLEPQTDAKFKSEPEDDLFADLMPSNDEVLGESLHDISSLELSLQPNNPSTTQPPETLDFIPEFTNEVIETKSINLTPEISPPATDLLDNFGENSDQDSSLLFNEDFISEQGTHIQLNFAGQLVDDLFTDVTVIQEFPVNPEILNSGTDTNSENLIDATEINFVDNLLADNNTHLDETPLAALTDTDVEGESALNFVDDLFADNNIHLDEIPSTTLTDTDVEGESELNFVDDLFADKDTHLDETPSTALTTTDVEDESALNFVDDLFADKNTHLDETPSTALTNADAENSVAGVDVDGKSELTLNELAITEHLSASLAAVALTDLSSSPAVTPELSTAPEITPDNANESENEFAELEALLETEVVPVPEAAIPEEDFAALEALLDGDNEDLTPPAPKPPVYTQQFTPSSASKVATSLELGDEFSDLEKLLAEADQTISHSPAVKSNPAKIARPSTRRSSRFEETMKVPVKQLDDMSNLVGELVVNRNTLEQDHERLRQSLDNLLIQVQQLSDVGARMQELYERSLLESSLLASRKNREHNTSPSDANTDRGFSELEMDRFTPFHTLSQEMIEMIVRVRESASDIDFVTEETERVARQFRQVTTQLQEGLTRARMVPFSQAIDRLRRGVRDNAIKYGKQVELVIEGGETLIDKMILDHLTDPLTHMLNNAIAHGVETPEIRQAAGKSPTGEITIRAFHQGNQTVISVGDDGAGIDSELVKAKALKLGMITAKEAKTMTRVDVYDLLFHSGFSIKDKADEISGRGVGMDVVRSEISEIRGTVSTDSTLAKGTTFTIRLPLTLSICKALCCVSDKARIAFPMDGVEDTLDIPVKHIQHNADGQAFISWRDTVLPFRPLKELLAFNRHITRGNVYGGNRDDDMVSVVVVRSANTLLALQIDLVLSEQEIVIKQFEGPAPKPIGVAGATVLGDGRIMPIADVLEIMDIFQGRMSRQNSSAWQQKNTPTETPAVKIDPTVLIVDDSITVRELLSLTFNKAGYRVEQARDGQEAWDKLRSGLPCDIVFCDIEMPRCDGLELLSRIQKDSNLNHLPIAMLTSRGADKHRQMAIQLGASGYFTKPYLEEALLEAAVRMLKGEKLV